MNAKQVGQTYIGKNFRKEWKAESVFQLDNGMFLVLLTMKRSNGRLATFAQAENRKDGVHSFMMFQDFNKIVCSHDVSRVTEKAITEAHSHVLRLVDGIVAEANKFYEGKAVTA